MDRTWTPAVRASSVLRPARISSIILTEDLRKILFHVRYVGEGDVGVLSAEVVGTPPTVLIGKACWERIHPRDRRTHIGQTIRSFRIGNSQSATGARWKTTLRLCSSKGASNRFPIGLWTGTPDTFAMQRRIHIDTIVQEVVPMIPSTRNTCPAMAFYFPTQRAKQGHDEGPRFQA